MNRKTVIIFCLTAGLIPAGAQLVGAEPTHLTLAQTVVEAMESSPRLHAQAHRANAASQEAAAASRSRFGELNATASYGYLNDDQILRVTSAQLVVSGLPFDRSQAHYGLVYEVPLFLGGRLVNQVKIAGLEARKAEALLDGTRWQIRFNAVALYSAAQALDGVSTALRSQIAALEQTKTRLEVAVTAGKRPELDRLKLLDELESTKAQQANVAADRTRAGALLLALLGRDPAGVLIVDPMSATAPAPDLPPEDLRAGLGGNTAVHVAQLEKEQAERATKVARSAFLPRVIGSANYLEHTGFNIDRSTETWGVSVGVVFPLFSGTSDIKRMRAARERYAAAEQAVVQAQLNVGAEFQETLARLHASQAGIAAAVARVAAATEAAHIEQVRYDTGAGIIEDLLRAQAREEGALAALATATADRRTTAERLNTIVEKEIVK
jgi:outer membrane protein TolC